MKYFIIIIVFFITFFSTLSEDRKWYYIDSVEIDGRLDRINQSIIVVDSLNNKYFFERTGRVIKFDNNRFFNLNIPDYYIYSNNFEYFYPRVDVDNSLWWFSASSGPKLDSFFLTHFKNNIITKYSIDSLFVDFGISTNKSIATSAYGICINNNGVKYFLADYGIVSYDNKAFSIDTTFSDFRDSIKAEKKFIVNENLFISSENNLLYIIGIRDYKIDSTNYEIFVKTDDNWKHLTSIWIYQTSPFFKVDKTGKFLYLVHGDKNWKLFLKIYDIESNEWYFYELPGNHAHGRMTVAADFNSKNHLWYHESAPAEKYFFIFANSEISTFNYPDIPFKKLSMIESMRFDIADNLWCSSYYPNGSIFVYAKENPLSVKNRNVKEYLPFHISPNPVNEKLTLINIPDNATEFEIYDQFGNRQISGLISGQIDASLLPPGVYFIKLNNSLRPLKFLKI